MHLHEVEEYHCCHDEEEVHDEEGKSSASDQIEREEDEKREDEELELFYLAAQFEHWRIALSHSWRLFGKIIEVQSAVLALRFLHLLLILALLVFLALA